MASKSERRKQLLKELEELENEEPEAVDAAKDEAKAGGSEKEIAEAAEEEGASPAQAKAIAKAVVQELKDGGYLVDEEESKEGEAAESEDKAEVENEEKKVDEKPADTHRWYK